MAETEATYPAETILAITGMTCNGCANALTRILSAVPGVTTAKVDFTSGEARVTGDVPAEALIMAVAASGYGARLARGASGGGNDGRG